MLFDFALLTSLLNVSLVGAVADTDGHGHGLRDCLSSGATVTGPNSAPRWSTFDAPQPAAVVNVAVESDVACVVQYANSQNIPFLAQNGGHGSATTLGGLKGNGVIINLAALKNITYNADKTQATIGGGALVGDVVASGFSNGALFQTATVNCVGTLGAMLGGGVGYLQGMYGLGTDTIVSLNVVTADGKTVTATATQNKDLFFAMRGAGPNFGIVTSAVVKSFPVPASGLQAFTGPLIFTAPQLEDVVAALGKLTYVAPMAATMIFANSGNVTAPPAIVVDIFYYGSEADGRKAFAPVYAVKPVADMAAVTPYNHWNDGGNSACGKGPKKPQWGAGLARLDPATWRSVYTSFSQWIQQPGAANSTVMMDVYSTVASSKVPNDATAYPFRDTILFNAIWAATYSDSNLDATAVKYGSAARSLWRSTSGLKTNETYINNAFGDESLTTVYGGNLERLRSIKRRYDSNRRFNFWFPLS